MSLVELARVTTSDGLRLDGSLALPQIGGPSALGIDVAILVHGTGSNFYGSTLMDAVAAALLSAGVAVARINTRGHDAISTAATTTGNVRQGAAYERVSDCVHDLTAWLALARERGFGRPALVGHSLGAVKSIYMLAQQHPAHVSRLIAISPPRLSFAHFASRGTPEFKADHEQAQSLVAAGKPDQLMEIRFPLPYVVSAAGYLDKYGSEERYNALNLLPRVSTPSLVLFGSLELQTNLAFQGMADEVEQVTARHKLDCQVGVIAGADHFYAGGRDELCARIVRWLKRRREAADG